MSKPASCATLSAAAAALLVVSTLSPANAADASDNGRYEGVNASETAVWVVDSRTGQVRKCTQEFADQAPVCSKPSN